MKGYNKGDSVWKLGLPKERSDYFICQLLPLLVTSGRELITPRPGVTDRSREVTQGGNCRILSNQQGLVAWSKESYFKALEGFSDRIFTLNCVPPGMSKQKGMLPLCCAWPTPGEAPLKELRDCQVAVCEPEDCQWVGHAAFNPHSLAHRMHLQ